MTEFRRRRGTRHLSIRLLHETRNAIIVMSTLWQTMGVRTTVVTLITDGVETPEEGSECEKNEGWLSRCREYTNSHA